MLLRSLVVASSSIVCDFTSTIFSEEKKALGSSNSASGDAELVSGVLVTVNGESLESKPRALEQEP